MKKFLLLLSLAILGCNLPIQIVSDLPSATPTATAFAPTQAPIAPIEFGTEKNPLILALAPASHADPDMIAAGEEIAAFIEDRTGYRLVTIAPASETSLVDSLDRGNAHIAVLSPFGYLLARQNDSVTAIMASTRNGELLYGAQFIANRESGFVSFYDSARNENAAEAPTALQQFQDKKPCWSDALSPSGYVAPLGFLNQSGVKTQSGAFLAGQANVVRAVYANDICNFGATYIDARKLPALEASYPDVSERVIVVWRVPNIIPYENISISNALPIEMRRVIQRAFIDLILSSDGKSNLQKVYGLDAIQVADDALYAEFEKYALASGLEFSTLIK
ncbi:MAG: PhnD/SsuA/transferrin family substrate-binding protein [Anaerolineales bacterium]|nr:PhnD/SsuA/transferrin family substrate-binding protein [Anaerolineales bacterium]